MKFKDYKLWIFIFMITVNSYSQEKVEYSIVWSQLPSLPDKEGFAGCFAGVSDGYLLVAGGANFPDKKPWENGKKVWYDDVYAYIDRNWKTIGKLPRPLGYGVSITTPAGVVCIGGSDAIRHYSNCFLLKVVGGKLKIDSLPSLPINIANMSGAKVGSVIYVFGGSEEPGEKSALNRLFAIDMASSKLGWRELEKCPGKPRLFPVAAGINDAFFVAGGAAIVSNNGKASREYLKDTWMYQLKTGWRKKADLPMPSVAAPCPAPVVNSTFYVITGDDGSQVGFQPVWKHPGFSNKILVYNAVENRWKEVGKAPFARATLPAVFWNGKYVFPSGEMRPGVRSPEVWVLEIKNNDK